jgi:hypothetical protein
MSASEWYPKNLFRGESDQWPGGHYRTKRYLYSTSLVTMKAIRCLTLTSL